MKTQPLSLSPGTAPRTWTAGREDLSLEMVEALARKECAVLLEDSPEWIKKIQASVDFLEDLWTRGAGVYGVTTGVGDSVTTAIPAALVEEFPARLLAFHGCGLGKILGPEDARAVVAVRLANLVRGLSGVRPQVLELLVSLLKADLVPQIPEEGSVGASGDLTPLSYLAAVLTGERMVWYREESESARRALERADLTPVVLRPKEALAIMNGTAVMAALGARVWVRARRLALLASLSTALASRVLKGNPHHFDPGIFQAKPHSGTIKAGRAIQKALGSLAEGPHPGRLQDSYSLRCAPHIIGVLYDTLEWSQPWLETEINGVSDNPLLDPSRSEPLHGGNFYGGHVALAMESLKNAVAQVADLLDRQVHLLLDPRTNRGLPANLSGSPDSAVHHGLKALGIAASAWAAEALKTSLPSSVFSRSTESHNQDKVSLGTLAAREGVRVLELTEQVLAAGLVAGTQGAHLRKEVLPPVLEDLTQRIRKICPPLDQDRALDGELRQLLVDLPLVHSSFLSTFDFLE